MEKSEQGDGKKPVFGQQQPQQKEESEQDRYLARMKSAVMGRGAGAVKGAAKSGQEEKTGDDVPGQEQDDASGALTPGAEAGAAAGAAAGAGGGENQDPQVKGEDSKAGKGKAGRKRGGNFFAPFTQKAPATSQSKARRALHSSGEAQEGTDADGQPIGDQNQEPKPCKFKFQKGFTNAIRRPVYMQDLL